MFKTNPRARRPTPPAYKTSHLLVLIAAITLMVSAALPVKASPEAQTSSFTFLASSDSQVTEAVPDKNYGNTTYLQVDGDSGARVESYILFTVSGLSGPVSSAVLRVYDRNNGSNNGPI